MSELPHLEQHAAPLDVCHKVHSGVAVHVMPGCTCDTPTGSVDVRDAAGNIVERRPVKLANHVMVHEANGDTKSISLDQARNAGYIN